MSIIANPFFFCFDILTPPIINEAQKKYFNTKKIFLQMKKGLDSGMLK
jgi:hypothetical protein